MQSRASPNGPLAQPWFIVRPLGLSRREVGGERLIMDDGQECPSSSSSRNARLLAVTSFGFGIDELHCQFIELLVGCAFFIQRLLE
jgi:hypothetical protein